MFAPINDAFYFLTVCHFTLVTATFSKKKKILLFIMNVKCSSWSSMEVVS